MDLSSAMPNKNSSGLYIVLISVHGLIRGDNLELGRDADNGGQIKYLVELAKNLGQHPEVDRVDLLTRQVFDAKIADDYSQPMEQISDNCQIIRIPCGPKRYLRKEVLWPHLDAFADRALKHIRSVGRAPDVVHGHYADAGFVGAQLASILGVPLFFTGHSLGRDKLQRLRENGMRDETIDKQYNIWQRIEAEEYTLDLAATVITSTQQEVDEQYQLYDNYQPERMVVIPPGVELDRFHPPGRRKIQAQIKNDVERFLQQPKKPMILALARADRRKNVRNLVIAYAQNPELQEKANLVLIIGNRDDVEGWEKDSIQVFQEVLMLIDHYDLYGRVAYPKQHAPDDVPLLYQLAAKRKGVFINPALTEPFGLTIIEAAASSLPVIATQNGGPVEIIKNCRNGLLFDPENVDDISNKLTDAFSDSGQLRRWAKNGLAGAHRYYSWSGHAQHYIKTLNKLFKTQHKRPLHQFNRSRLPTIDRLLICDIDNTLIGDGASLKRLLDRIHQSDEHIGLGVATGRHLSSAQQAMQEWEVPHLDFIISSVGTEIHYGPQSVFDGGWARLIEYRWNAEEIRFALKSLAGLRLQPRSEQRPFKVSYFIDPHQAPSPKEIKRFLRQHDLHVNVVYSHGSFLDVLPMRASKGSAVRYIADKWGIPFEKILVAGDSGNDIDMLRGDTLGVVVGNHTPEVKRLRGRPRIYFAEAEFAQGIIEGIDHYDFLGRGRTPDDDEVSDLMVSQNLLLANI
ncbi:MAG: HAD-IIB family hydrolase [Gammaproteobacteria bacterium]|nr:HAD-IIB family hydrolase [Gammaproteobacteria bacterium]MDH5728006.1 HAD-IIB family hydrolase [Gammaproteobacteria bacterium]